MSSAVQIYVALLGEDVDVWRPVQAEPLSGSFYQILPQPYERDIEQWEFEPGDIVFCEYVEANGGPILVATRKAARDDIHRT